MNLSASAQIEVILDDALQAFSAAIADAKNNDSADSAGQDVNAISDDVAMKLHTTYSDRLIQLAIRLRDEGMTQEQLEQLFTNRQREVQDPRASQRACMLFDILAEAVQCIASDVPTETRLFAAYNGEAANC